MEDAATAEISRTQVWQWTHHGAKLADGRPVDAPLIHQTVAAMTRPTGKFALAARLFEEMILTPAPPDFLTLAAYDYLD
jgi:malate synthase